MKTKVIRMSWVMLMVLILVFGAKVMEVGAVVNLKVTISVGPPMPEVAMLYKFAELVKEKTGGSVEITVYPSAQLGSDQQVQQGVRLGTIDMGCIGLPWHTSFAPGIGVLNIPYLFSSYEHAYRVLDGEVGQELARKFIEPHGIKVLGYPEIGFRCLSNSKKVVEKPEDVKGLKIRTTGDPSHIAAWKIWGAIPVPMPVPEMYMAMKTGAVDGQENPVIGFYSLRHYEVQKYLSLTNHAYAAYALDMNLKKYQSLSPFEQKALTEALREAIPYQRNLARTKGEGLLTELKEKGIIITENPDRDAFAKMIESVFGEYSKTYGTEYLEKIKNLK
jgi:tripartite ATP-independent transporter DctP family solute receptor